jgi:uncharacterized membrane protein
VEENDGLNENTAGLLCYLGLWVTGLIFFLTDKRPFVRFHGAQSIAVFGGLQVIYIVFGILFGTVGARHGLFFLASAVLRIVELVGLVLWIFLMVKAFQHEKFKLPVTGEITDALLRQG